MAIPFEVHVSTAIFTSVLVGLLAAVGIGTITFLFLTKLVTYRGSVPDAFTFIAKYSLVFGTITVTIISLLVFGGLTYLFTTFILRSRRETGDATSMPLCRMPSITLPRCRQPESLPPRSSGSLQTARFMGKVLLKPRYIVREIDMFGKDLIDALRITSVSTPSLRMKEFIQGAMGSIASGSNLTVYFRTKADQYAIENRQTQKLFLDTLGLIAESYVTAMVAGPLFLIILQSIMSVIGNNANPIFLYVII